jgi:hypothetical protein
MLVIVLMCKGLQITYKYKRAFISLGYSLEYSQYRQA